MFSSFILVLCMLGTGLDFLSAVSAVMAAINNLGPGLGSVAANYSTVTDMGKVILCIAMLLGPTRNIYAADLIHADVLASLTL
jgi:trk system potassium uptake protein TrkH